MDIVAAGRQGHRMSLRIQCLCIDTTDPARLAAFWAVALGWRQTHAEDDEVVLEPPAGSREDGVVPDLLFLRVPESLKLEVDRRAEREKRSTNAEIQAMLMWALRNMPEQLHPS